MEIGSRRPLGEILLELGVVDKGQLRLGLVHHHEVHVPLGRALVSEGVCTEADVLRGLAIQFDVEAVDLDRHPLDRSLTTLVPSRIARQYGVVPLRLETREDKEVLHLAVPAPLSLDAVDDVRAVSGKARVEPHLASDSALSRALSALYGIRETSGAAQEPPRPVVPSPPLMLYGWPPVTAVLISRTLARNGIPSRVATPLDVLHTRDNDVVLAPLQAMEGLLAGEVHIEGSLIVHGTSDDEGFERARKLEARGFLANPRDEELLLRAVRRLRPDAGSESSWPRHS
ncbi:general secretion pathway protein GspE [Corallococcus exiguus]|uniref:GspE/PulE/PilB domain-containing protein n=1 Tax=Corallococcus TaxID=83461 RepID=UPI000EBE68B9|nr:MULTISPECIES: general secretion pathway protein GspE [Corallococcus]NNB84045.1 general secretion pathway protein GspE [Corallococcus exiguus]NNB92404.1 general secretion pathway protein GspE [Corallococcus exiguus]NNC02127.1 general secretion pathway protein GspE [Corallococcus exiguus]NPC46231.1 general secretion pathway protein GspE [Corallococcus exiguus]RKH86878.1 general secretion pathway protein GspE [Corallococcus sp. AB032C]